MTKILIFSTAYFPFVGGAEVAVKEISDRLGNEKFSDRGGPVFGWDLITVKFNRKSPRFEKIGNINVYRVGLGIGAADKFLLPFLGFLKALKLERENRYNIAWSIMASQASVAAAFFKIFNPRVKLILTLQEGDEEEHLKRYVLGIDFLYKILIRPWHSLVFKKADYITAISGYLKDRAVRNGVKCGVEIVPNGVDVDKFQIPNYPGRVPRSRAGKLQINFKTQISNFKKKLGISEDEKIIITTSRLVEKNGIEDLIGAIDILVNRSKLPVKLLICGEGELEEKLKKIVGTGHRPVLTDKVLFLGQIGHRELPQYLWASDVFCRPSLSEGLGNSFLEAMAAGIPVVATPVGGILDFLIDGQTGWFCKVKDPESIAEKIKYILDEKNREEVSRVIANAKKMVEEKYNWDNIALKMNNIFNALKIFRKQKKELAMEETGRKLKVLIATGIFPPDIGGPAKYAKNLSEEFLKRGNEVKVLAYKTEKKLPIGIRHCLYFFRVVFNLHKTDLIIALDTFSVGLPAVLAAKIFRKKIIIRTGGDFLWETYVEKTGNLITLKEFYYKKPKLPIKHRLIASFEKFALRNACALAFNSLWQKEIFERVYSLDKARTFVIENHYGEKVEGVEPEEKNFLFAGRRIKFKNLKTLEEVFEELKREGRDVKLEIVDNLSHNELMDKIRHSYALVVPSITDFAPNFIIEGLSFNKPFILTKECGLVDKFKDFGVFVNPFDKDDIKNKILFLAEDKNYNEHKSRIENFNFTNSWQEIADEFLKIYENL
ncbi:MAG: glycosyltransferase family 4 protein [bacterium]|nr:glycosyltransferase family 4 protein [bacterium]